jgi:hypothetical protein
MCDILHFISDDECEKKSEFFQQSSAIGGGR